MLRVESRVRECPAGPRNGLILKLDVDGCWALLLSGHNAVCGSQHQAFSVVVPDHSAPATAYRAFWPRAAQYLDQSSIDVSDTNRPDRRACKSNTVRCHGQPTTSNENAYLNEPAIKGSHAHRRQSNAVIINAAKQRVHVRRDWSLGSAQ